MSVAPVSASGGGLAAVLALSVMEKNQAGIAAAQAALRQTAGGGAAPMVSSSATAPGALELFA
jgi:hypothetical protein